MAAESSDVGTVGEEAVKLLRALAAQAPRPGGVGDDEDVSTVAAGPHVCTTSWCPVCQVVGYVKEHPEVVEELTDTVVTFARSVREVLDRAAATGQERR